MTFAQAERAALCDLFDEVGPDAPTLCEGWLTRDLATHLWIREAEPLTAAGMFFPPLRARRARRMDELRHGSFSELVDKIRRGPVRGSLFSLPGADMAANAVEFFVHHEDVRRAGADPRPPRQLDPAIDDWLWKRTRLMAKVMMRRSPVGVVLERDPGGASRGGTDDAVGTERVRVAAGAQTVTLLGRPGELLLYVYGRKPVAELRKIGTAEAVARLDAAS